ncbi:MAG: DMT family transporter [Patescibacteria group bacterium]
MEKKIIAPTTKMNVGAPHGGAGETEAKIWLRQSERRSSVNIKERKGELILIGYNLIAAFFPIVANYSGKLMPPILFAALSNLLAAFVTIIYLAARGQAHRVWEKKTLPLLLGVSIFIIAIPSALIFWGAHQTSGINTSLFLQMELPFTLIIYALFFHEVLTARKYFGAMLIGLGSVAILYNGSLHFNWGDLAIIASTIFFPLGNWYAKRAIEMTTGVVVVCARNLYGGVLLLIMSFFIEPGADLQQNFTQHFWMIALYGIVIMGLAKQIWYAGLKYLSVSKAISIHTSQSALSLVYAMIFLREIPTLYQWMGLTVIMGGLFAMTYRGKTPAPLVEPK